jgi:hypothetical protein
METGEITRRDCAIEAIKIDNTMENILQALFGADLITRCI